MPWKQWTNHCSWRSESFHGHMPCMVIHLWISQRYKLRTLRIEVSAGDHSDGELRHRKSRLNQFGLNFAARFGFLALPRPQKMTGSWKKTRQRPAAVGIEMGFQVWIFQKRITRSVAALAKNSSWSWSKNSHFGSEGASFDLSGLRRRFWWKLWKGVFFKQNDIWVFSRMRSEGSRFTWGSGGEAVFAKFCVCGRNRSQPFATVRNRS